MQAVAGYKICAESILIQNAGGQYSFFQLMRSSFCGKLSSMTESKMPSSLAMQRLKKIFPLFLPRHSNNEASCHLTVHEENYVLKGTLIGVTFFKYSIAG
jgi:hypothetical protein